MAWLAAHGVYLHRGPLVHVIVTYPYGVARSRLERIAVAAGYVAAMVTPAWGDERSAIVLGSALIVVAAVLHARSVTRVRRARLLALWVAAAVGLVIAGGAAARLILFPSDVAEDTSLLGYQARAVRGCCRARRPVSCLVRWSGPTSPTSSSSSARNARIGFATCWPGRSATPPSKSATGRRRPTATSTRRAARCHSPPPVSAGRPRRSARTSDPIGILIHHPSLLDDPGLTDSIATAARLASVNARLQAEVRAQIVELEASRRRIVTAGDEQHRRLECRLRGGAERRLENLARPTPAGSGRTRRRRRHDAAASRSPPISLRRSTTCECSPPGCTLGCSQNAGSSPPWTLSPPGAAPTPGSRRRRAPAGHGGGGGVLRLLRGPGQRRQARRGHLGIGRGRRRRSSRADRRVRQRCRWGRPGSTGPGCSTWPTGSTPSAARSTSPVPVRRRDVSGGGVAGR